MGTIIAIISAAFFLLLFYAVLDSLLWLLVIDTIVGFHYLYTGLIFVIYTPMSSTGVPFLIFLNFFILLLPIVNFLGFFKFYNEDVTIFAFIILTLFFFVLLFIIIFGWEEPLLYLQNIITSLR